MYQVIRNQKIMDYERTIFSLSCCISTSSVVNSFTTANLNIFAHFLQSVSQLKSSERLRSSRSRADWVSIVDYTFMHTCLPDHPRTRMNILRSPSFQVYSFSKPRDYISLLIYRRNNQESATYPLPFNCAMVSASLARNSSMLTLLLAIKLGNLLLYSLIYHVCTFLISMYFGNWIILLALARILYGEVKALSIFQRRRAKARKVSLRLWKRRSSTCLARLAHPVRLFSAYPFTNSKKQYPSMDWQFPKIKSFSAAGLLLPHRLRTNSPLSASPRSNYPKLPPSSSLSHRCQKNSSKPILAAGSLTSILFMKSWASLDTSLGNSRGRLKLSRISLCVNFSDLKKGEQPKSIWQVMTPRLQMSHFSLYYLRQNIYGAIVSGVPTTERKNSSSAWARANPKSASFIQKSQVTNMLESFRSRCTTLCCLITLNAAFSFSITLLALASGSVPPVCAFRYACKSVKWQCSKTRQRLRAVCLKSSSATMFSCLMIESTATSCWMRYSCLGARFYNDICFTAYLPPDASLAQNTVEQEPFPMGRRRMYGPIFLHFLFGWLCYCPCYIQAVKKMLQSSTCTAPHHPRSE